MLRVAFRTVLVLSLTFLAILKGTSSRIPPAYVKALSYWLLFSGLMALGFLVYSAVKAATDARNRRLYLRDAMLAIVWIIFWLLSLSK